MEIVCRGRTIRHLHVVFGAELEIALEPGRGVLRPLPLVAMRQKTDKTRHPEPLALAGGDELVKNNLCAVGKITELSLPEHQAIGLSERITILESEHCLFRKHRIDDF